MPKYSRDEFPVNSIVYERTCPFCNQAFWANKPRAIYCSAKCRVYGNKKTRELQQTVIDAYAKDPAEAELRYGPVLIEKGNLVQLLYYNPIEEELRALDPDGTFALEHITMKQVQPLEKVIAYHTLHMKHNRFYYKCMRRILEEDQAQGTTKLTAKQRIYLEKEQKRIDGKIMELHVQLQRLHNSDESKVNW
ncbi:hypothetical protein [Pontibacter fetidus]|uniref:Uncharacterized protein n=1 Tax=Pontibacter fetidus TaxID=2700082 RepID=A0A6B2H8I1_9BACT|nr:hypothetical protein [Pontibacter fetidus]NDK57376.1 hypothetical protein [Pontibacter fetidus]